MSRRVALDLEVFTFDIDFAGHVSNLTYLRWLEIGRLALLKEAGHPIEALVAEGVAPVLTRTEIDYRRPLRLGDPVRLELVVAELRGASATLASEITTAGHVAAAARQTGVFVDLATGRPRRLAPDVREAFARFVAPPLP